jgi:hypothetical protein
MSNEEFPTPLENNQKRKSEKFLPRFFRSDSNKKFLAATVDNLIQNGTVRRVNGFIGRQNSKAVVNNDVFIKEPLQDRQHYQLEPCLISEDVLGNVNFYKDYIDYINTLSVLGANTLNHQKLNQQEFYSWEPHIDFDKFVNYQSYYWLPFGPEIVSVSGTKVLNTTSTFSVTSVDEGDNFAYVFSPDGLTRNPVIKLYRGETYKFEINSPTEPFSIKSERVSGKEFRYTDGVDKSAVTNDVITFTVPNDAPEVLYYVSENNVDTSGVIKIFDIIENTKINVDEEIIGKKDYILSNGISLTNGMKIRFAGQVSPKLYEDKLFYVEGVGDSIRLVDERSLEISATYTSNFNTNFDSSGFDDLAYNNVNYAALKKDYITINRSSRDRNHWSRYNRWFHAEVIKRTAEILGKQPVFDQALRATRPIIEFKPNIKLYNFGNYSKKNIDILDNYTKDAFSIVEGAFGYYVDGIELVNGHRIIFNAEQDPLVKNKIYKVEFLNLYDETTGLTSRRIHLAEEPDTDPILNECVLVMLGKQYSGQMFWYNGTDWIFAQAKSNVNQAPLFDLFDENGVNLDDSVYYEGSTFRGNKIFSYKPTTGPLDSELGFALSYKNISNFGDILFDFNLLNESFNYKSNNDVLTDKTDNKFLKVFSPVGEEKLVNGWVKSVLKNVQPIIRIFRNIITENSTTQNLITNNFPIDVYDDKSNLEDLVVKVYINGIRLDKTKFSIIDGNVYKKVLLDQDVKNTDIVTLKCYASQNKNKNGYYEFPINFQNNPNNDNIKNFTLGEIIDHVDSIVDNLPTFEGIYPGSNNLRDLAMISTYGTKFVQHSGSINFALYHLTNKEANIIQALDKARDDYGKFKRSFLYNTIDLEDYANVKEAVDIVLTKINQGKTKQSAYYFSDMLGYGACNTFNFVVKDENVQKYPLAEIFTLDKLSPKAINIYINNLQLLHGRDYTFTNDGFIVITKSKNEGDIISVIEYEKTDGCFVPATPTSLGLYPKFEPRKYLDTTLIEPKNVIQGHDGSIMLAFNDFRDDLILELETRIFNNIKTNYDPKIFDIYDYIPGSNRPTNYNLEEFNRILSPNFFKWTTLIDTDFTKSILFLTNNPFTYNFSEVASINGDRLQGFWRGIYKWYFDTDRINLCPWESLGFSIKPTWWNDVYGPEPYTKNNHILWNDLRQGIIREPNKPILINKKFVKPILENIPVDEEGNLLDPIESNLASGFVNFRSDKSFVFGDQGPVENAWRRSSYYPFSLIKTILLMNPNKVFATLFDRSRIIFNRADQLVYSTTGLRIKLKDIQTTSVATDDTRLQTSGLINYVMDYLISDNLNNISQYRYDLKNLTNKLSHRLGGFSSKEKFNLILENKSANASSGVFIPKENYKLFLNSSSPVKKLFYSGIIITKLLTKFGVGYEIKGYSQTEPYFFYYGWDKPGYNINVGGISESFINWESDQRYVAGNIVKLDNEYYRVKISHTSSSSPSMDLLQKLPALPIIGGRDANIRSVFDKTPLILNYGTILGNIQDVVDFIQGYGEYLKDQGFEFDEFNQNLKVVTNWETSIKEFLFWTTQNWSSGADQYVEWESNTSYQEGQIVYYSGDFYRSIQEHTTNTFFDFNYYNKLDNLNTDGAAAISLSPSALKINLNLNFNTVDDLRETANTYEIFSADGVKYDPQLLNYVRYDDKFSLYPKQDLGIYGAAIYLVQKEHVLVIDNTSQFNDVIYNIETGYRQDKIKIAGYKTINWNGSFDAPGFIYDQAILKEWTPWTDYYLGDIVKYKEFYYSATKTIPGVENFNDIDWVRIDQKPESRLLPNWDYKALQFTDFYDLDSDNFDVDQQRIAQHLIGYQKRQYLENIIKNDVSEFKFYQGMITEKGTANSLNKLFDVLSSSNKDSIDFVEEWAVRIGEYGASDAFEEIEFILDESKFKIEPQAIELVPTINNLTDYIIRQTKNDIYLKPKSYNDNIWPINTNYRPFLKTPGFCRLDQVKYALDKKDDILNLDITTLESGDYIWCAFENKINEFRDDWCVYRVNYLDLNVKAIETPNNTLKITFNINPRMSVGDIIGLKNNSTLNKILKISAVADKTVTIQGPITNLITNNLNLQQLKVYKFAKYRFENIDNIDVPKYLNKITDTWNYGEIVWFNNQGNQVIWQNIPVYNKQEIVDSILPNYSRLGQKVCISNDASILLITSNDQVRVYKKINQSWIKTQVIEGPEAYTITNFGKSLAISEDNNLIAIGFNKNNNGAVNVYNLSATNDYVFRQELCNPEFVGSYPLLDEFYGYKIKFSKDDDLYSLFISSTNGVSISGKIYIYNSSISNLNSSVVNPFSSFDRLEPNDCDEEPFAYDFDVNKNGSILVLSAALNDGGKVYVHERKVDHYSRQQIIDLPGKQERFGFAMALNDTGELLAVSSIYETVDYVNQGRIRIYKTNNALDDSTIPPINYTLLQVIDNRNAEPDELLGEQYGYYLKFANNSKTLVVFSRYGDSYKDPIVGEDSSRINRDSGRVDVYDRYINKYIFSESLPAISSTEQYGFGFDATDNNIIIGAPNAIGQTISGKVYLYVKENNVFSWRKYLEEQPKIDISVFKKIFLYNRRTNKLLDYVDIIDPVQGKIAGVADQEIKYKTYYDPAIYNFQSANNTFKVNVDEGMNWLEKNVGVLWWDLRRAKFLDSTIGDTLFRNSTWSTLYPTASIDIYEWVESKFTPEQWDTLSGSEEGFSRGISGTSLYGNKVYSVKKKFDTISKTFSSLYYYWVKNKTIVPNVNGRKINSIDLVGQIQDPKNYGIKFIQFLNTNSFSLANVKNLLADKDILLSVQYWTVPEKEKLIIHNEWKIISENANTDIPLEIERKWIDSLVGIDENGYLIPDLELSPKQRYGIEFKPRQSMFINRVEAVKQLIERFNYEIKNVQIDNLDLSDLLKKDPMPSQISRLYDYVVDTVDELKFISGESHRQAKLTPIIENGKLVGINVVDPGLNYTGIPAAKVVGMGKGAVIVDNVVVNSGEGYDIDTTSIVVRPLTVLVKNNDLGQWALYAFNSVSRTWTKIKSQEYDVSNFWYYIDWYSQGYNQFTKVDYIVQAIYELFTLKVEIGQVVKVNNPGSDWLLLEKYSDVVSIDYTRSFKVVGRQNGSLQLSSKFYDFYQNRLGFDGSLYDTNSFDNVGSTELRIILNSLKNKILIDDRRKIYVNLFFTSIRYLLSEQPFVDWIFKTSFIKALHNVGELRQKINYTNDNLPDFESYIKEVKPYRTKIREFTSIYSTIENTQSMITDFDLPSYITNFKIKNLETNFNKNQVQVNNLNLVNQYPWKFWYDNLGFQVDDVVIKDSGSEYVQRPNIRFEGECTKPARARAFIVRGQLVKIEILDKGEGYFKAPKVIIDGNVAVGGREAVAYASIGNNLIRSNKISMKFDRFLKGVLDSNFSVENMLNVTDTFQGTGLEFIFKLRYLPSLKSNSIVLTVNGKNQIIGTYSIVPKTSIARGYTEHYAELVFNDPPIDGANIVIEYKKDFVHLNALERINWFYNPKSGMIGRDFVQLMNGIDYGGVNVLGTGFEKPNTWDGLYGWGEKAWDAKIPTDNEIYDTIIDGGNLNPNSAYRTASGLLADDIIIDGDGFITPNTSPAPEEMLPGHVVDSVAISVFERSLTTSSDIISNNYVSDGVNKSFKISQYPNNKNAIIVKIDQDILKPETDYNFDYDNLTIILDNAAPAGSNVSITSLGLNGENILTTNQQVITSPTREISTDLDWQENILAYTLVSGEISNHELFKTTEINGLPNKIGIRFTTTLAIGQVVNYSIFLGSVIDQSLVTRETFTTIGTIKKYYLNNPVGKKIPLDPNTLVRVGNIVLNSIDSFKYTMSNNILDYDIPAGKADIDVYSLNDYVVYIDGVKVDLGIGYTMDLINSKLNIKTNYYKNNAEVIVTIIKDADYFIEKDSGGTYILFKSTYPVGTEIEVIAMFNHDILNIERKYYIIEPKLNSFVNSIYYLGLVQISAGIFSFDREVLDSSYVWLTKNKKLLTPNIDYILLEDRKSVRIAGQPLPTDKFSVITFSGNVVRNPVSFMKFKDMLNRFHYKRISKNRTTRLERDLGYGDKELFVENPGRVNNAPGVLYVNGERIEYYFKVGNRLGQLRRGTYGTGVPTIHQKFTEVYDIGESETIPYNDEDIVYRRTYEDYSDSTKSIYIPFLANKDNIEVFIGTRRLRKNAYMVHDKQIHPESPEGDVELPAEFSTNGNNYGSETNIVGAIVLNDAPPPNVPITVIVKRLNLWNDPERSLSESTNKVAYFLKYNVEEIAGTELTLDSGLYSTDSDDVNMDEE